MATMQIDSGLTEDTLTRAPQAPRIALITSYNGGNLGDAAIQDSLISNLRSRVPGITFLGITLNCENFVRQHGADAFPLLASMYSTQHESRMDLPSMEDRPIRKDETESRKRPRARIRQVVRGIPGFLGLVKTLRNQGIRVQREILHSWNGYRLLRRQDLLLFSGGGQLDEEYGGAWRLPFAQFKWALLARLAGLRCAMVSIGTGSIKQFGSRGFISLTLRMCCYRSFREAKSRAVASALFSRVANDSVVPDLALSMPDSEIPRSSGAIRRRAGQRPIVALSPICYAKPGHWPTPNRKLYDRYLQEMAQVLSSLVRKDYFVVLVCSSLGDDESVIPDLLERLPEDMRAALELSVCRPEVHTWRELVAVLRETDFLVASRLHGTILGFVTGLPVVAISFNPKVDWVMEDLKQTEYLLQFRDFTGVDVLSALSQLSGCKNRIVREIAEYRHFVLNSSESSRQYDRLCDLALEHLRSRR